MTSKLQKWLDITGCYGQSSPLQIWCTLQAHSGQWSIGGFQGSNLISATRKEKNKCARACNQNIQKSHACSAHGHWHHISQALFEPPPSNDTHPKSFAIFHHGNKNLGMTLHPWIVWFCSKFTGTNGVCHACIWVPIMMQNMGRTHSWCVVLR